MSLFGDRARAALSVASEPTPAASRVATTGGGKGFGFVVLGSGSGGNSVLVRAPRGFLLIDAGFSCHALEQRIRQVGVDPNQIRAILLTHEHGDHCRGLARFVQRHKPAVFGTRGTFTTAPLCRIEHQEVVLERPFELLGLEVSAFPVPHDARDPVGYVLEDSEGHRLGLASDLGCRLIRSWRALHDLDALIVETNHDPHLLETGPYPFALKRRVASRHGHLSNPDAAMGLPELLCDSLQLIVLYHLSRTNNRPELARQALASVLDREGVLTELLVTSQFEPTRWAALEGRTAPIAMPAGEPLEVREPVLV